MSTDDCNCTACRTIDAISADLATARQRITELEETLAMYRRGEGPWYNEAGELEPRARTIKAMWNGLRVTIEDLRSKVAALGAEGDAARAALEEISVARGEHDDDPPDLCEHCVRSFETCDADTVSVPGEPRCPGGIARRALKAMGTPGEAPHPSSVTCPVCGAEKWGMCSTASPHPERVAAATPAAPMCAPWCGTTDYPNPIFSPRCRMPGFCTKACFAANRPLHPATPTPTEGR
jgi:hypothetical protein